MKFRTDFVTNSSSSNYSVEITIRTEEKEYIYSEHLDDGGGNGTVYFKAKLSEINDHLASIESLLDWLMSSIYENWTEDEYPNPYIIKRKKFINSIKGQSVSLYDIKKIRVKRDYSAWGEFSELVASNDQVLRELCQKYMDAQGEDKDRAKAKLITYVQTTENARGYNTFGINSEKSFYSWNGNDVEKLANDILGYSAGYNERGVEVQSINLNTGEIEDYSIYYI